MYRGPYKNTLQAKAQASPATVSANKARALAADAVLASVILTENPDKELQHDVIEIDTLGRKSISREVCS